MPPRTVGAIADTNSPTDRTAAPPADPTAAPPVDPTAAPPADPGAIPGTRTQRRGRSISMTKPELDEFLGSEHTCRVATVSPSGPHNTPLWFAWDGDALWLTSIVKSQRWTDLQRDPRVAIVVDAGTGYAELRGVEIAGTVTVIGDAPRPVDAAQHAELVEAERLFAAKYTGGAFANDGRHGWLRVTPDKITSWDFRKSFEPGTGGGSR